MDRAAAARKLVAELVAGEQIELRRAEIVGRDLARFVEALGRPPTGDELEDWLGDHAQVSELYVGPALLEQLVDRHLAPPPPAAEAAADDARNPELERQLRAEPERGELYLVYADGLQERADPLGELIALGVAAGGGSADAAGRFERHLRLHEARLLGGLAAQLANRVTLRWRHGFVQELDEQLALPPPAWQALLGLRVCELVESIALGRACPPELDIMIAEHAPTSLRALTLEVHGGRLPPRLLARELRRLAVRGDRVAIDADALPGSLEYLELYVREVAAPDGAPPRLPVRELHAALTPAVAAFLAGARLPRLEGLTLYADAAATRRVPELLASLEAPALAHLSLSGGALELRTFAELTRLPLAARLSSLALTSVGLDDAALRALVGARGELAGLAELDVSGNELTQDGLAAARELAPRVVSRRQHRRGAARERNVRRWAGSRLAVAEEIAEPSAWRDAGVDGDLRWARYQGQDAYELYVSVDLERYGCSCPSGIQPCKHVVALALIAERTRLPPGPSGGIEQRVHGALGGGDIDEILDEQRGE
jgi:uncharacterized protein (TIGR02996 family)